MRRAASLNPHKAGWKATKKTQNLSTFKSAVDNNAALPINTANLKNMLGQIKPNDRDCR